MKNLWLKYAREWHKRHNKELFQKPNNANEVWFYIIKIEDIW